MPAQQDSPHNTQNKQRPLDESVLFGEILPELEPIEGNGNAGTRTALFLVLIVLFGLIAAFAGWVLWRNEHLMQDAPPGIYFYAMVFGFVLAGLACLWVGLTMVYHHFSALERVRIDILLSLYQDLRFSSSFAKEWGGREVGNLAATFEQAYRRHKMAGDISHKTFLRLIADMDEGVILLTSKGLISLYNRAADSRLPHPTLRIGTSIYHVFERPHLVKAFIAVLEAGSSLDVRLKTLDGTHLPCRIVALEKSFGYGIILRGDGTKVPSRRKLQHDLDIHTTASLALRIERETKLDALDIYVLDCETTGLDVKVDRIVSIGAVRVKGNKIHYEDVLDILVNPLIPIPTSSSEIHGITDAMVAAAPGIDKVIPELTSTLKGKAIIGHNIPFDLTLLRREAKDHGLFLPRFPALDLAVLSAALDPDLQDYNLDNIAARYGVEVRGRHSALGDALVTAEIYLYILTRLKDRGLQTYGDAVAFGRKATKLRSLQIKAGWDVE